MEPINLDDPDTRHAFLATHGTVSGRLLANRLGLRGPGTTRVATQLSCYAWNMQTAEECRLRGTIDTALMYEQIAERIYKQLPAEVRW